MTAQTTAEQVAKRAREWSQRKTINLGWGRVYANQFAVRAARVLNLNSSTCFAVARALNGTTYMLLYKEMVAGRSA